MNCLFYDKTIGKKVPCVIIPGELYPITNSFGRKLFAHVYFDNSKFIEYNVSKTELIRYSSEFIELRELYPSDTHEQIEYANLMIPTGVPSNIQELDRYESLINMITNIQGDISEELFYNISDFISYELLFTLCTQQERFFMARLSSSILTQQPEVVLVPQMIKMTRKMFEKYTSFINESYTLDNYNNYYEHNQTLPIILNVNNLKYNVNYIII